MERLNKEYKLDACNHIVLKYGSVNRNNPQVIYVSGRCWVSPLKEMDYAKIIEDVESTMKKNIKKIMIDKVNFDDKLILDFDVNVDGMSRNRKTFLSFDFYLRQNEKNKRKLPELKQLLYGKISTISNNLVFSLRENNFTVEKKK